MIRINLLPFRAARKKENIRRQISIFFLSFFLLIVGLFAWYISNKGTIGDLKRDITQTNNELAKYKKITDKIQEIKAKLQTLEKKTEVINKLERNRFEPVILLDTMSAKVIPKRMWFEGFSAKGNSVRIDGIALDNKTVADFMTRLEGTGLFKSVQLKKITMTTIKNANLKKFQIECTQKGAEPAAAPARKKPIPRGRKKKK
jgi:type IV pilus assembly protein PilN